ncbi:hypothetical protein [Cytobacillus purgationiresistens]|uniref:Uncharacterized protein n=1 Tax=Cytobacillus purgationiresistens TaxID=863449 RepID=A0ABU0AL82_9BACI|nr:hypothetical protein [Cytobacillus purgationiresistens]MDQ0270800.1 hypothetical protein [Cytobacillus purgationiresistens]
MRKLANLTALNVLETEADGITPKAVSGILSEKQVSTKKARVMTEEQRQAAGDRLRKLREESAK